MDQVPFSRRFTPHASAGAMPHIAALRDALPRWRARIFWSFQVVFWLAIGAAVLGLSRALKPTEPTPWLAMAVRVGTGFVISTAIYLLFESPRLRGLPRRVRWPLMVAVAVEALYASVLLLIACGVGGPADWTGEKTLGPIVTRLVAVGFWCAAVFGLEMIQDLYKTEIQLAEAESASIDVELRMLKAESAARTFEVRQLQGQMNPHFLFLSLIHI